MPDIIIKGMEMPKKDGLLSINIWPTGLVTIFMDLECKPVARAVELPPHGDLIDRDAILNAERNKPISKMMMFGGAYVIDLDVVRDAPVVVPAERSDTDA